MKLKQKETRITFLKTYTDCMPKIDSILFYGFYID